MENNNFPQTDILFLRLKEADDINTQITG